MGSIRGIVHSLFLRRRWWTSFLVPAFSGVYMFVAICVWLLPPAAASSPLTVTLLLSYAGIVSLVRTTCRSYHHRMRTMSSIDCTKQEFTDPSGREVTKGSKIRPDTLPPKHNSYLLALTSVNQTHNLLLRTSTCTRFTARVQHPSCEPSDVNVCCNVACLTLPFALQVFGLAAGAIGFYASLSFVWAIYSSMKSE